MPLKAFATSLCLILACMPLSTNAVAGGHSLAELGPLVPIAEAAPTLAPFQHVRFCLHYPADCKSDPTDTAAIELTAQNFELLSRVNLGVNAAILPERKNSEVERKNGWTIAPSVGDCNDYAVTKRHELLESGLPASALRLAVVKTSLGIGHLVLVVATTRSNLVLDNLTDTIRPWQSTDYHWLKIQSSSDARFWYEIKSPGMLLSGADRNIRLADRSE